MKKVRICLDRYLEQTKISRYWLSKHTGIHITTIGNYYKNKVIKYDSNLLSRMCTALDCDISDIIECVESDNTHELPAARDKK